MTVSFELWQMLFPVGGVIGLVLAFAVLGVLGVPVGRYLALDWLFVIAATVAGGMAAPVALMASARDNTNSPTPAPLTLLVMAAPVLVAAGYRRYEMGGNRRVAPGPGMRLVMVLPLLLVLVVVIAGQAVVAADAYSCVDDDCFRLPAGLRPGPFVAAWLAACSLWASTMPVVTDQGDEHPARPWSRFGVAALLGVAGTLAFWPIGVTGSYTLVSVTNDLAILDLNRCGSPIIDAFGHDDFASASLPDGLGESWGSVHCRPAAETRLLWATAVFAAAVGVAAFAGAAPVVRSDGGRPQPRRARARGR